jgi:hypothetical protein
MSSHLTCARWAFFTVLVHSLLRYFPRVRLVSNVIIHWRCSAANSHGSSPFSVTGKSQIYTVEVRCDGSELLGEQGSYTDTQHLGTG